jgi:fructokinase
VLVVGEALVDVVHRADGVAEELPGGSPANVALALGRLGTDVELLTDLGDDDHGRSVGAWLAAGGVRVRGVERPGRRTSTAVAHLGTDGSATYEFDLAWDPPTDVALDGVDVVHAGSIAAVLEPGAATVADLLRRARATATVTYDPNARPAIMRDSAATVPVVEGIVASADVVKVSDEDLAWLHPHRDPYDVLEAWRRLGPAVVVLTRGADGAVALTAAGRTEIAAPVVDVVDTVGAGDTFMAALVDGLRALGLTGAARREALRAVSAPTLRPVLARAARAAAITVARPGADPPTGHELGPVGGS